MTKNTIDHDGLITRRMPISSSSWDPEARTFTCTFSTGAPVQRYDARGAYTEELDVSAFTFAEAAPFLDHHKRFALDDVLGTVLSARTVGGKAEAVIELSRHSPSAIRLGEELADGKRFGISAGYSVEDWRERTEPKTGARTKTAVRWTVRELSVVSIPADPGATTRGFPMEHENPAETPENTITTEPAVVAQRAASDIEVRSIARASGLDQSWVQDQIDAGASVEFARAAALSAMRSRTAITDTIRPQAVVTRDDSDPHLRIRAVSEALFTRTAPEHQPSEQARPYVGMSIPDIARDCLRASGATMTGLGSPEIVTRALHTTSDFALILGSTVNRHIRTAYEAAQSGLRKVARQTTARDFRAKIAINFSAAPALELVNESGEFKSGTLEEAHEAYRLQTFGKMIGISRQALINDDLNAFGDLPRKFGIAAAAYEASHLVKLLTQNGGAGPVLNDTKTLFHADHKNVAASGSALSLTSLSAARLALRQQTGLVNDLISVTPKFLVVGSELETDAEAILTTISATKADDVNPFASRLVLVVEPRLTGKQWFVVADPAEIDGLEYAYLEGEPGPQIETDAGFNVDGVRIKVRLDFGAGFVEHRSWYRNPGA